MNTQDLNNTPPAEQSEAQQPLPRDSLYAAGKRASASGAKLRCRKCGDNYELTFNYAALRGDGVGQEGPTEQQGEQKPVELNALEKEGAIELWFKHHSEACGGFSAREKTLIRSAMMATFPVQGCSRPDLVTLRAKVEALPNMTAYDRWCRKDAVLAEIDRMGGKV